MKAIVLGAGMQGMACAFDMAKFGNYDEIILADIDKDRAEEAAKKINSDKVKPMQADISDPDKLIEFIKGANVVVSAVPYFFNLDITRACIKAKVSMCDMGGNTDIVFQELALDKEAKEAGVTIIPDCGLAPGLANIVAAYGISKFDEVNTVKIRVGGLPQIKRPPMDYKLVFSAYGLLNEYSGKSYVLKDGQIEEVYALTEKETFDFKDMGELEAFHTSGGISTMPWTFKGRVKDMDYKTIRYPGHLDKLHLLKDLGLMDTGPVKVRGVEVIPRDVLAHLLTAKLDFPNDKDLIIMRVEVTGLKEGKKECISFDMLDYHDEENDITSMMRTTAYPVSIIAQMISDGRIKDKGSLSPEVCVPAAELIEELKKRNINIVQENKVLEKV
ncbi:MAG: saccharopine dehydrogenase C-terminal domain-containing protein [Armatimonadota bacterium]